MSVCLTDMHHIRWVGLCVSPQKEGLCALCGCSVCVRLFGFPLASALQQLFLPSECVSLCPRPGGEKRLWSHSREELPRGNFLAQSRPSSCIFSIVPGLRQTFFKGP